MCSPSAFTSLLLGTQPRPRPQGDQIRICGLAPPSDGSPCPLSGNHLPHLSRVQTTSHKTSGLGAKPQASYALSSPTLTSPSPNCAPSPSDKFSSLPLPPPCCYSEQLINCQVWLIFLHKSRASSLLFDLCSWIIHEIFNGSANSQAEVPLSL